MNVRISKELAQKVLVRPVWLKKDRDWQIFVDYRDGKSSAEDLAPLYGLGRQQVKNILRNILSRSTRTGSFSNRAAGVLRNLGADVNSESFNNDLQAAALRGKNRSGSFSEYLDIQKHCGPKTRDEILAYLGTLPETETARV